MSPPSTTMHASQLLRYLRQHRLALQASVSASGSAQAAVVGFAVSDQFEFVFDTVESTRKALNIRHNPRVALVVGGWVAGDERTAQIDGIADEPVGDDLERLTRVYYGVYPDGRDRLSWKGLIYVRVRPTWIRYSDYLASPPRIVEFTADQLVDHAG
jgi:hypothetical protein